MKLRPLAAIALVAFVGAVVAAGAPWLARRSARARLPELPTASRQAAMARHLRDADRMARANPTSGDWVGRLGMAYQADMLLPEADAAYTQARALAPGDWKWPYLQALVKQDLGDSAGVLDCLRLAVRLSPAASAWWRLGDEAFKRAQYDEAVVAFEKVITQAWPEASSRSPRSSFGPPLRVYAIYGLARVALARGDRHEARQRLEALGQEAPRFGPAHRLLGEVLVESGNGDAADAEIALANGLRPYAPPADPLIDQLTAESQSTVFLLTQAVLADRLGDLGWKQVVLARAAAIDPNEPQVLEQQVMLERQLQASTVAPESQAVSGAFQADHERGRAMFETTCALCHDASGAGQAGRAPALVGSPWLLGPGDRVVRIALNGLHGPRASAYATGMPSWRAFEDRDLAAILSYARGAWNNRAGPISASLVAAVRRATDARVEPWTYDELSRLP